MTDKPKYSEEDISTLAKDCKISKLTASMVLDFVYTNGRIPKGGSKQKVFIAALEMYKGVYNTKLSKALR